MNTITLAVERFEMIDGQHFKHYTVFTDRKSYGFFGFGRIGASWQWSVKNGPDALSVVDRMVNAKRAKGYELTWRGQISVPEPWCQDPRQFGRQLTVAVDEARAGVSHDAPETAVAEEITPLGALVLDARTTLTKMAVEPDMIGAEYARLVGEVEAAKDDLDLVTGYIDTLRIMLTAGEARSA